MNTPHEQNADQLFDELLRDIGPEIPQPELADASRERLLGSLNSVAISSTPAIITSMRARIRWIAACGTSIAAILAVSCVLVWSNLKQVENQLTTSQWETNEVLELLMRARQTQPLIKPPDQLDGVTRDDLILLTFHHDLCPLARISTPSFKQMATHARDDTARFMIVDVTGEKRDAAQQQIDASDLSFALHGPLGAETGVVKVLDMARRRVLCSAPGKRGIAQAQSLLERLPIVNNRP